MASSRDAAAPAAADDNEDEWEYEYSTTETETYYLTLDLPARDFSRGQKEEIVHNTRGGYRVWYDANGNAPGEPDANAATEGEVDGSSRIGDATNDDDASRDHEGQDRPAATSTGKRKGGGGGAHNDGDDLDAAAAAAAASPAAEQIQILDLHSEQPLIYLRGMVFRGAWAENVGTELLFAYRERDPPGGLPALRHLPEDVDLLAASSARIHFRQVELRPKTAAAAAASATDDEGRVVAASSGLDLDPERYERNGGIYVHVHSDKFGLRRPQANFLEDLTALKRKRGETDEVTITTVETPHTHLLRDDLEEEQYRDRRQRDRERHRRRKGEGEGGGGGGETGQDVARRVPDEFGRLPRRRRTRQALWGGVRPLRAPSSADVGAAQDKRTGEDDAGSSSGID